MHPYNKLQYGKGLDDIRVFRVPYTFQSGRNAVLEGQSLASLFKGLAKFIFPTLKESGKFLKKELLKGTSDVLQGLNEGLPLNSLLEDQKEKRMQSLRDAALSKIQEKLQKGDNLRAIKRKKINNINELMLGIEKRKTKTTKRKKNQRNQWRKLENLAKISQE
jgi:hypothetical protein